MAASQKELALLLAVASALAKITVLNGQYQWQCQCQCLGQPQRWLRKVLHSGLLQFLLFVLFKPWPTRNPFLSSAKAVWPGPGPGLCLSHLLSIWRGSATASHLLVAASSCCWGPVPSATFTLLPRCFLCKRVASLQLQLLRRCCCCCKSELAL